MKKIAAEVLLWKGISQKGLLRCDASRLTGHEQIYITYTGLANRGVMPVCEIEL